MPDLTKHEISRASRWKPRVFGTLVTWGAVLGCVGCAAGPAEQPTQPAPAPALADLPAAPANAEQRAEPAPEIEEESALSWELRNNGWRGIGASTEISEASIAEAFPECEADWQRHKGRARSHIALRCKGSVLAEFELSGGGQKAPLHQLQVLQPGVTAPSGLGVGSSYRALSELLDGLVCRGVPAMPITDGVIHRPHTVCIDPRFPKVGYVFRGVVFSTGERPPEAETLRIGALRFRP